MLISKQNFNKLTEKEQQEYLYMVTSWYEEKSRLSEIEFISGYANMLQEGYKVYNDDVIEDIKESIELYEKRLQGIFGKLKEQGVK